MDVSPYLTSDPVNSCLRIGYRPASSDTPARFASMDSGMQQASREGGGDLIELLGQRIRDTRNYLLANLEADDAPFHLRFLVGLHRQDVGNATGEWEASYGTLMTLKDLLSDNEQVSPAVRRVAEGAVVVLLEVALASEDMETASQLLSTYEEAVSDGDEWLTFALNAIAVDEAYGRYETALDRIDSIIVNLGDTHDSLAADLVFMAEIIAAKAGVPYDASHPGQGIDRGVESTPVAGGANEILPFEYALHASYPNPTLGVAILPLDLPESAAVYVEVFDILGRRVTTLWDGILQAGRHELSLNGNRLAAGTYLIVAQIEAGGTSTPLVFRQKLTVLR